LVVKVKVFYQELFTPADAGKIMRPSGRLNDKLALVGESSLFYQALFNSAWNLEASFN